MAGVTVLLGVAHGSKTPASQEVVEALMARVAELRPGLRTVPAYVDNASPSIARALRELVAQGVDDVVVLPLLLSPASHSKTDVAASVQAGRIAHPGLRLRYGRPLGPHPVLVDVLARRLAEAGVTDGPVVLAAGGSLDPDANAQVAATARLLWEGRGFASVDIAFASTTGPTVAEAVTRLRDLGATRVALARYFLGPGYLPRLVETQARSVDGVEIVASAPLGASDGLAGLLAGRYDEVLGGDTRMNCDACVYRIAMPGREQVVGAPQLPHSHPDDEV
ncbi:MAG: sirohydrochlorin chelatase [Mycobacteriales bacterium]|nr:sirohydrochlorin chelatase [Mycobacteriales bacterium]